MFYDYQCTKCASVQEVSHGMNDSPEVKCEDCGSKAEKVFSFSGNIIFKGDGWGDKERKMKKQMTEKNTKMKGKMIEREKSGEAVNNIGDLKAKKV